MGDPLIRLKKLILLLFSHTLTIFTNSHRIKNVYHNRISHHGGDGVTPPPTFQNVVVNQFSNYHVTLTGTESTFVRQKINHHDMFRRSGQRY